MGLRELLICLSLLPPALVDGEWGRGGNLQVNIANRRERALLEVVAEREGEGGREGGRVREREREGGRVGGRACASRR